MLRIRIKGRFAGENQTQNSLSKQISVVGVAKRDITWSQPFLEGVEEAHETAHCFGPVCSLDSRPIFCIYIGLSAGGSISEKLAWCPSACCSCSGVGHKLV